MMTFPVILPSGAEVQVGGEPLGSDEKLKRLFPDLWAAVLSRNLGDLKDNAELEAYCFAIVKHFNPGVQADTFCIDHYSAREIIRIWMGQADDKKKAQG